MVTLSYTPFPRHAAILVENRIFRTPHVLNDPPSGDGVTVELL